MPAMPATIRRTSTVWASATAGRAPGRGAARRGVRACARCGGLVVLVEEGQVGSPRRESAARCHRMTGRVGRDWRRRAEPSSDGRHGRAARGELTARAHRRPPLVLGRYRLGRAARRGRVRHRLRGQRRAARAPRRGQGHPVGRPATASAAAREALAAAAARPPGHRRAVRRRRGRRAPLPRLRARRGPHARRARAPRASCRTATCCGSGSRSRTRSRTPTTAASSTATSSRRT